MGINEAIQKMQKRKLKKLDLSHEGLLSIPPEVFELESLEVLDLSSNNLGWDKVPEVISHLKNLTHLNLSQNNLNKVPEAITRLENLTSLHLGGNKLTTVPKAINHLQKLTYLDLHDNQLATFPESITRLENLTSLHLASNQLTALPEAITRLENLTSLYLGNNQLTTLPEAITRLKKLSYLGLGFNRLTTLPEYVINIPNLVTLILDGNLLETPPIEVAARGLEAMGEYFRQMKDAGEERLFEAKLIIVGEPGAGKTSLTRKIENPQYQLEKDERSTLGIDVVRWNFPLGNGRTFRVNIWDFGGQQIYHATHQFFLTKRSIYALVADSRKEDTDFYYWLNVVDLLSNNSPLLIIKNEVQDRHREIPETKLRGQFKNLKETLSTNLATNRGLDRVVDEIKHHIQLLPHVGASLPQTWVRVREALEADSRNYVSLEEYLKLCQTHGFTTQQDKLQLSGYLHDLGVCLHFQEDPLLKQIVILKPTWGTDAVYKVLDNKGVIAQLGHFTMADLSGIWSEPQYASRHDELLQLMINFKLCYRIPGNEDTYIAPQLLTENQPNCKWDEAGNLIMRYKYEFMPKGILTQFIVATHPMILDQNCVWRSGVVIEKDQTRAEVIEHYEKREIKVRVAGKDRKKLLDIVDYELHKIHESYRRLKYSKLIPCNCQSCKDSQLPEFYPFEVLSQFVDDKKDEIQCRKPPYNMVNVLGLIDDVMDRVPYYSQEADKLGGFTFMGPVGKVEVHQKGSGDNLRSLRDRRDTMAFRSAWANGLFYLFTAGTIIAGLGLLAGYVPFYTLGLIIVAGLLFVPLIGAFQLRHDKNFSEKSFMELIRLVFKQLPLIGKIPQTGKENTDK